MKIQGEIIENSAVNEYTTTESQKRLINLGMKADNEIAKYYDDVVKLRGDFG